MSKDPTYNDIMQECPKALKKFYRLSERQLEQGVRKHLDGASQAKMNDIYQKIYDHKGKK